MCLLCTVLLCQTAFCFTLEEAREVQRKANQSQVLLRAALEQGQDVSAIIPMMKQVKVLGEAHQIDKANALLDSILLRFSELETTTDTDTDQIFVNPRKVTIVGLNFSAMEPFISRDSRYLFFNSEKNDPAGGDKNIYYAERIDDITFRYKGEVKGINTKVVDGVPTMDREGNFYFVSIAGYNKANHFNTVYRGKFRDGKVKNIQPLPELSLRSPGWLNMDIEISADGNTLYATQTWFGDGPPPTKSYFFSATRKGDSFIVDNNSEQIFSNINTDDVEYAASISTDQLELFFTRGSDFDSAPAFSSYYSKRDNIHEAFGEPEKIRAITGFSEAPAITDDGSLLYYHKKDGALFHLYVLERKRH